jgi:N-acetylglucosaminyl-diphospho-decaprenol L-rhamnosyltransferase
MRKTNMDDDTMLSIITVSWNSRSFLADCIRSAALSARPLGFEHVLVDNASSDGSPELVEELFPEVTVIRNAENLGFARANNIGARRARGRYLLFLNPDTVVLDDALEAMVKEMERDPALGVLGPKLLTSEMRWSPDMGYRVPSLRTVANQFLGLSRIFPIPRLFPGIVRSRDFATLEDCGWVSGACLMVSRAIAREELWNEEIFFFGEDIEYCDRIRGRGFRIRATPDARVVHHSGKSMAKQSLGFLEGRASGLAMYLRRTQGPLAAWIGLRLMQVGYRMRVLFHRAMFRLRGSEASLRKTQRLQQYMRLDGSEMDAEGSEAGRGTDS